MTKEYQEALFYFIDKAFDYRTPNQHLYVACAYYMKELFDCDFNRIERNRKLLFETVKEINSNAIPCNLEKIINNHLLPIKQ